VDRSADLSGTLGRTEEFRGSSPGLVVRNELGADCRFTGCCPDLTMGSRRAVRRSVSDFRATPVFCESVGLATMLRVGFDRNVEFGEVELDLDDRLLELVLEKDEELGARVIVEDREGTVLRRVIDGLLELRVAVGTDHVLGEELGRRIWLEDLLRKEDDGCRLMLVGGREEPSERDVLVERDCKDCL